MERDRNYRRDQLDKAKRRAKRRNPNPDADDRTIGRSARTPRECSCWMCKRGKPCDRGDQEDME